MTKYSDSLRGYGHATHKCCNFTCVYCGYDGRSFPKWLQLTIDHVIPTSSGGSNTEENFVTACQACNSITSRMKFDPGTTIEQAREKKKSRVLERQKKLMEFWKKEVESHHL